MRIDLEQFLAVTMMLGTAGAIGVAVYAQGDDAEAPQEVVEQETDDDVDAQVAATPAPPPPPEPAPAVEPTPEGPPPLPEEPDADFLKDPALDGIPAPHIEGFG